MNHDSAGNVISCFVPPTDKYGRALSHEEWCERRGRPYTEQQHATRAAFQAYDHAHRDEMATWRTHAEYVASPIWAEWCRLGRAIDAADRAERFANHDPGDECR